MTERNRLIAALQAVRHAMIAMKAGAPALPPLFSAEEHLLRVLFDENEVAKYLASPGAKVYGR
jgi:hypothetical protein